MNAERHVGEIRAAEGNRAGATHPFDTGVISLGDGVGAFFEAIGIGLASLVEVVLDREGNLMKPPQGLSGGDGRICGPRGLARLLRIDSDDGVDPFIDLLDAYQVSLDDLEGSHFASRDGLSELSSPRLPELFGQRGVGRSGGTRSDVTCGLLW